MTGLLKRMIMTSAGWAVGGFVVAVLLLAVESLTSSGVSGFSTDPYAFTISLIGGAVFAVLAAALRASGSFSVASRPVHAVLGAVAMLAALLIVDAVGAGSPLAILEGAPYLVWISLGIGAVLGWCTLAVGGARE